MRPRISIRGFVRRSVGPSVRLSIRRSIKPSLRRLWDASNAEYSALLLIKVANIWFRCLCLLCNSSIHQRDYTLLLSLIVIDCQWLSLIVIRSSKRQRYLSVHSFIRIDQMFAKGKSNAAVFFPSCVSTRLNVTHASDTKLLVTSY